MENVNFTSIDQIDDISSRDQYRVALEEGLSEEEAFAIVKKYSRDNARTPFQWDDSENAGFTTGKPWLTLNPNYKEINAKSQVNDPDSLFSYYKKLIRLRKDPEHQDVVVYGEVIPYLVEEPKLMAFYRKGETETLLVLGNFQTAKKTVKLPSQPKQVLLNNVNDLTMTSDEICLEGYQAVVLLL